VVFYPSVAADYRIRRFFFGADIGVRARPITEFAGARVGTQWTNALGAGLDVLEHDLLALLAEGRAYINFAEQHDTEQSAFGIVSQPNGKSIIPAEWMVGLRSAPLLHGDFSFYGGGGGPIPLPDTPAITTPRFRFVLGLTYAPMGRAQETTKAPFPATPGGSPNVGDPHTVNMGDPHKVEPPTQPTRTEPPKDDSNNATEIQP
jgi:hypothetical protein